MRNDAWESKALSKVLVAIAATAALAASVLAAPAAENVASLIIVGGRVWTAEVEPQGAEAIAVQGDRILAVGSRQSIESLADENTEVVDASGGLVVPGFIDSHVHLFDGGQNLKSVQLRDADSREEFVARIGQYAAKLQPGEWILGGDWDHTLWGGELPRRDWIDDVTPNNPVWIQRLDGHMALANSLALQKAGVQDRATTPEGGAIERDEQQRITGLLRDNAMSLVTRAVPRVTDGDRLEALDAATDYLLANGVTCVHHMGSLDELRALRAAHAAGLLRLRVRAATPLPRWRLLQEDIKRHGRGDEWLAAGSLKGFVDGSLGSHTAAMLEPFADAPSDRGLLVNSPDDLYAWTAAADAAGLQVAVHAIGDRAIRLQLDIFERVATENGPRDRRFRIEHAQHIHPDDLSRFGKLGVLASMQPYHAIDDGRWAESVIGPARCQTTYAFRDLMDTGARVAFGSDWFVAPASAIEGIYAAVTRSTLDGKHPDGWIAQQKISLEEALRAYTSDASYAMFAEDDIGVLRAGKLADVVVLDRDITRCQPELIKQTAVRYTLVAGKIAYRSDQAPLEKP